MGSNKELFDVIYLTDKELGINSGKFNGRPCVILELDFDNGDYNFVIPMTTKPKKVWDENSNKISLSNGSYISANDEPIRVTHNQIFYGELAEFSLTGEDIDKIEENF